MVALVVATSVVPALAASSLPPRPVAVAGFVVDALLGEFQAVIKPLGKLFERLAGISGSTILGNGEVALILDVPTLVQRAVNAEAAGHRRLAERTFSEAR